MTHPTDEELDALVRKLEAQAYQQGRIARHAMLDAKSAITALRAQLAEADAKAERRRRMHKSLAKRYAAARAEKARADRAEAEVRSLKAAIFGSENYAHDLKCGNFVEMAKTLHAAQKGGLDRAERAEAALAAQMVGKEC